MAPFPGQFQNFISRGGVMTLEADLYHFRITRMVFSKENSDKSLLKIQIRYCIDIFFLYTQMSTQFLYKWLPKSIFVCFSFADFARANIQHFWASQQLVAILDDDFTLSESSVCTTHRLFRYARLMRLELYIYWGYLCLCCWWYLHCKPALKIPLKISQVQFPVQLGHKPRDSDFPNLRKRTNRWKAKKETNGFLI